MRVLLVGHSGQVATACRERMAKRDDIELDVLARPTIDLSRPVGLANRVAERHPDIVINAAAYTAVDKAESEADLAQVINVDAVAALAAGAEAAGATFVHLSTDYVFDGRGGAAFAPDDPTAPLGVYGRTKHAGEQRALECCSRAIVVRTSWVYSPFGHNFVRTMLRLAGERQCLKVVADQFGNPTSALDIARGLEAIVYSQGVRATDYGIYHLAGTGVTHWADFAREIFRLAAARAMASATVADITTADYPTPAARPANSCLDTSRFTRTFGYECAPWPQALVEVIDRMAGSARGVSAG